MRIALLFTGFLRHADKCQNYIKKICKEHECDIYVATWNERGTSLRETNIEEAQLTIDETYIRSIYGEKVKRAWIGNIKDYEKTRTKFVVNPRHNDVFKVSSRAMENCGSADSPEYPFWPNRLLDQWYVVNQGKKIIPLYEYDIIYKSRADLNFITRIPFECSKPAIHTSDFYVHYAAGGLIAMEDKFAWGPPSLMEYYLSMGDHIQAMYDRDNIDASYAEHIMAYYLTKWNSVPVCFHTEFVNDTGQFYGAHLYDEGEGWVSKKV